MLLKRLNNKYILSHAIATSKKLLNCFCTKTDTMSKSIDASLPRPVRGNPGKVRLGFVPDEFFVFFYERTGVSGFPTFCFTTSTYLVSKEIYVLEHEFYGGISMMLLCIVIVTRFGPDIAKYLDKSLDEYEDLFNRSRKDQKEMFDSQIYNEEYAQFSVDGQLMLVDAKREMVAMQLEYEYRRRLMEVYTEVKKRLDFFVLYEAKKHMYAQRNITEYVLKNVNAALTPDFLDKYLDHCISEITNLFKE